MTTINKGVDIGTTSTVILDANTSRYYFAIINDSDTDIYLALGADAVAHQGIRLNAHGGSFELVSRDMYRFAINGIHAGSGTKRVTVVDDYLYA